jgi:AraC family transcriptional regulator
MGRGADLNGLGRPIGYFGRLERHVSTGGGTLSVTSYEADLELPLHRHTRPYFCLVLKGGFREVVGGAWATYQAFDLLWRPPDEQHADRFGPAVSRCLNIEPDLAAMGAAGLLPAADLVGRIPTRLSRTPAALTSLRICHEIAVSDDLSGMMLEALILEVLALAARQCAVKERSGRPLWLARVTAMLHDRFRQSTSLRELAREAGVHPSHLTRTFHAVHGCTVGDYVRRLRVEFAGRALVASDMPLARIAAAAGFPDQSAFTRVFREHTGMTPGAFRRAHRGAHQRP